MTFAPSLDAVSFVRRFAGAVCRRMVADVDFVERVALATHELLENAVKYSADGQMSLRVDFDAIVRPATATIRTRNRVTSDHAAALAGDLDELARTTDRFELFQRRMVRCARAEKPGGLGLGRIAAEADMALSYSIAGDVVEVQASGTALPEVR
jgi:hypothetical protein